MQEVKKSTNKFINERKFTRLGFQWQEGYGAFSYSHSAIDSVIKYIKNQKEHHRKRSFREEYVDFLRKFEIDFDPQFLFEDIEN